MASENTLAAGPILGAVGGFVALATGVYEIWVGVLLRVYPAERRPLGGALIVLSLISLVILEGASGSDSCWACSEAPAGSCSGRATRGGRPPTTPGPPQGRSAANPSCLLVLCPKVYGLPHRWRTRAAGLIRPALSAAT